ncbi:hypothetical protein ACG74X_16495 [Marivita sp. S0852]|uniref:hypothetical protein n=1 Tax=Marivita sp. S0852 TaxID=3373893 RepID=UPI0039826005
MIPPRIGGPSGPPPPATPPPPDANVRQRVKLAAEATELSALGLRGGAPDGTVKPYAPDADRAARLQGAGPKDLKEALGTDIAQVQGARADRFERRLQEALAALPGPSGRAIEIGFDRTAPLSIAATTATLTLGTQTRVPLPSGEATLEAGFAALDAEDRITPANDARISPDGDQPESRGTRQASSLGGLIAANAAMTETIVIAQEGERTVAIRIALAGDIDLAETLARG